MNKADPSGNTIAIADPKQEKQIEAYINSRSAGTFKFNDKGELKEVSKKSSNGKSKYYEGKLLKAIGNKATISVTIGQHYMDPSIGQSGAIQSVDRDAGGGVTQPKGGYERFGVNQSVIISGHSHPLLDARGHPMRDDAADILVHELVGHAIPWIVGSDTGDAVSDENKVRSENPGSGQRPPGHSE